MIMKCFYKMITTIPRGDQATGIVELQGFRCRHQIADKDVDILADTGILIVFLIFDFQTEVVNHIDKRL